MFEKMIAFLEARIEKLKAMQKKCKKMKAILIIAACVLVAAAIAFAVYKLFCKDDFDDFDEELYFEDDEIEEIPEEEEPAEAE